MKKLYRRILKSLHRLNPERMRVLIHDLIDYNEQLEMVLSSIPGGVVVIGPNNRILLLNRHALRLLPLTAADPIGRNVWEVLSVQSLAKYVREALEEDRGTPMKDFSISFRGRSAVLSCGVLTLVSGGHIKGSMLYVEDVTEAHAEAIRRKRTEELASLTTMAAGVAHEIKNPLASMGIHIQLMRRRLGSGSVQIDEYHDTLNILEEELERLNTIVSNYLFTVRPIASNLNPVDINAMISDLIQFLRFEVEKSNVHVSLHLDENISAIPLDEGAMKQVLLNLIKNALAAMPNGGGLKLETNLEQEGVAISVSDTGHGIPEDIQDKIFEPYFTTRDTGSGLGLTVVYKGLKEHGGSLLLDSKPGQGTTFRIHIPFSGHRRKLLSGGRA